METNNTKRKILLVDDSINNIEILFELLNKDYEILFATNASKGIELANSNLPNLILLDIVMPEMDGFEACKQLKSNNITAAIPIIFLTAETHVETIIKGFEAGIVDYVTKPFNSKELYARVQTQITLQTQQQELQRQNLKLKQLNNQLEDEIKHRHQVELALKNSKQVLEEVNLKTQESIEYASLIQNSLIPSDTQFNSFFSDVLILWKPKDIVGGDIYLFDELRNKDECLLMIIDCVGHGVSGALVAMLVTAIEKQIITYINDSTTEDISPAKILNLFNIEIKKIFKKDHKQAMSYSGFDGAILYYNKKNKIMKFSGAQTPLFFIEDTELKIIEGCRHSVGYKKSNETYNFIEHVIPVKKGMQFYLTTDGYLDQCGGKSGFAFGKKRFSHMIIENHNKPFGEQQKNINIQLNTYQGDEARRDDITVVGVKI